MSVYAPNEKYDFEVRQNFFSKLAECTRRHHAHETSLVFGDFNTQLGSVVNGEESIIGPYLFEKPRHHMTSSTMNRSLFMEYCETHKMSVANSLCDYSEELLVSYHNLISAPMDTISITFFSQIDYVLCSQQALEMVHDCWTDRTIALRSHHFIMIATVSIKLPTISTHQKSHKSVQSLRDESTSKAFYEQFRGRLSNHTENIAVDDHERNVMQAFQGASKSLPDQIVVAKKNLGYLTTHCSLFVRGM